MITPSEIARFISITLEPNSTIIVKAIVQDFIDEQNLDYREPQSYWKSLREKMFFDTMICSWEEKT